MNKLLILSLLTMTIFWTSCDSEDATPSLATPEEYSFERNGLNTVNFTGQTIRIQMAEELNANLLNFEATESRLLEMYRNANSQGGDVAPFDNANLNVATQSIRSKVAASVDYFSTNTVKSTSIKDQFETWISNQVNEVFVNKDVVAVPGSAGQLADGSSVRYVNALGLEYDQAVVKGLMGALMVDQTLNNYLSATVLDENDNREKNNAKINEDGQPFTTMEHKWDEAYGYLYGNAPDLANPDLTLGQDDSYLNKYLGRLLDDPDFGQMPGQIYDAFKLGRAAIVANDYTLRDRQVDIIRENISELIGIRCVYYLISAKNALPANRTAYNLYGPALHDLSEVYGFIYSLQFTHNPATNTPYFNKTEVDQMLEDLMSGGQNGLWDVPASVLDNLASTIAAKFKFTIDQAGS